MNISSLDKKRRFVSQRIPSPKVAAALLETYSWIGFIEHQEKCRWNKKGMVYALQDIDCTCDWDGMYGDGI